MKLKRRLWVLLLSAAMIVTLLPAAAFAEEPGPEGGTEVSTTVAEPEWVRYDGPPLRGVVGTDRLVNLETPDVSAFIVTFTDGSQKTFVYTEKTYDDETDGYTIGAFLDADDPVQDPLEATTWIDAEVKQREDNPVIFEEGWNDNVELQVVIHYMIPGEGTEEEFGTKTLSTYSDVLCAPDAFPVAVEFIPAEGGPLECTTGFSYLGEDAFYGEGNAFKVSYYGWTAADPEKGIEEGFENFTRTYKYAEGTDLSGEEVEGFFVNGNVDRQQFVLGEGALVDLEFGEEAEAEFTYIEYVEAYNEDVTIEFKVPVKATKRVATANNPIYLYTRKTITPKFKVYDDAGKLIPAEGYDVEYEKAVKMGWYDATITFNDKFADKENYVDSITTSFGIGPQKPTIYKPAAGKGTLTVKWKKMTSDQLRLIDGFYIELSTDKDFCGNYKRVWVNKTTVKKCKKLIKGLKKGKKYYVRAYSYNKKFRMESANSNLKANKTKK